MPDIAQNLPHQQAQEWFEQGCVLKAEGDWETAAACFQRACNTLLVTVKPENEQHWCQLVTYQLYLARAYEQLNDKEKALAQYLQTIQNQKKLPSNHYRNLIAVDFFDAVLQAVKLLEEKVALNPDTNYKFILFKFYNDLVLCYENGHNPSALSYRLKIAELYEKSGLKQIARSVYVSIINALVDNNYPITDKNRQIVLQAYTQLAETTADNSLEKKFYGFACKFIRNQYSIDDVRSIFQQISSSDDQNLSFLLRYLLHLIRPLHTNAKIVPYLQILDAKIKAIQNSLLRCELKNQLSIDSACLFNTPAVPFTDKTDKTNKSLILRLPIYSKTTAVVEAYKHFAGKIVGKGAQGEVYAVQDWRDVSDSTEKSLFAVKVFDPHQLNFEEMALSNRYLPSTHLRKLNVPLVQYAGQAPLLFTQYIPGSDLDALCDTSEFQKLNFSQRINLITQISCNLNLLHHNTPATGNAAVHADIKEANIRASIAAKGATDARIIDFGHSSTMEDDPNKQKNISSIVGSVGYLATEVANDLKLGLKSDIYSITPVFLRILGVKNPLVNKYKDVNAVANIKTDIQLACRQLEKIPFDFTDILKDCPRYLAAVKPLVILFLERMQSRNYGQRPDSDEVLKFFTTLNNYCKLCEKQGGAAAIDDVVIYKAKMFLLAKGLWHLKLAEETLRSKTTTCVIPKSFAHFDLENFGFCSVITLADYDQKGTTAFLSRLTDQQKLEIYHELHTKKDLIVEIVGEVTHKKIWNAITGLLTTNLKKYHDTKESYTGIGRALGDIVGEYTTYDKLIAVKSAIKAINTGDFSKLWDDNTKQQTTAMKALRQGILGVNAKALVEYTDKVCLPSKRLKHRNP